MIFTLLIIPMPACKNCQTAFTISPEDRAFYGRIGVPLPTLCVNCRRQHLASFWPFGNFYQRKCDQTGESIISTFSPQAPFPVYKRENWLKDNWQVPEAKVNLDQPFLEQLTALQKKTPHYHQLTDGTNVNCEYCDDAYTSKNCYLTRSFAESEDLYFGYRMVGCKDCFDSVYSYNLEKCYSCTRCWQCYNTHYSLESRDCLDSYFLYDCRGCKNCLMCWNLRNAEYCIKNQQYSAAEYERKIAEINFGSWFTIQDLKAEFKKVLVAEAIHRDNFNVKTVNCSGNYLTESKNCRDCFFMEEGEDCFNLMRALGNKDIYDSVGPYRGQLSCGSAQSLDCYNFKFCVYAIRCRDSEYLDQCEDCHDCFGCVGLRKKSFCILNKQYPEAEYRRLVKLIKEKMTARGEYGEYLPVSMMYNGYNDTLAYLYFPENREQVAARGAGWQEEIITEPKIDLTVEELPDSIQGTKTEAVVNKTIKCGKTGKIFRYIPQEIKFYQANNIPLPRYYYNYRVTENFRQMAGLFGREAACGLCGQKITSYYPAEWGYRKIYCEECYRKEIY